MAAVEGGAKSILRDERYRSLLWLRQGKLLLARVELHAFVCH